MNRRYIYPFVLLLAFVGFLPFTYGSVNIVPEKDTIFYKDTCQADFIHYQIPGHPMQIKFIDNSTGNITSWHWDFGDGTISDWQNPLHLFPEEGTYNVCLTITDFFSGCTDTYCEPVYVGNQAQFYAFFDHYENPVNPLNCQFIDLSMGEIDTWQWDFGDGTMSFQSNPEHTYSEPGEYYVCLTVESLQGDFWDYYCEFIYIETIPDCQAHFEYIQHPVDPLIFHFQNTSIGAYDFWLWDFGDGTLSNDVAPTHTYDEKGIYLVCLEIHRNFGSYQCHDWYCVEVNATGIGACNAGFSFELLPPDPLSIQLTNKSLGDVDFWFWDFGDGATSYDQNPIHTYANEGTYNTCLLIVNNSTGCYDSISQLVEVFEAPDCEALFEYEYFQSDSMTVQFTDISYGMNSEWLWDFGDGNFSSEQNPIHTYYYEDTFNVCLTVSSIWGPCQDTYCDDVIIDVSPNCEANFVYEQNPDNPLEFMFNDASYGDIESWEWDFGDGTSSDLQNPIHTYTDEGEFEVCLTIFDDWGPCEDTFCDTIFIDILPECQALFDFEQNPDNLLEFSFHDASIGEIESWEWDFGDGTSSDLQNPIHTYTDEGEFEVCLTIFDDWGPCEDTFCDTIFIDILPECQALFDFEQNPDNLLEFSFHDASIGEIESWEWDFGDGTSSDLQNPIHTYTDEGGFEVCLTIFDDWGPCEDTFCDTLIIDVPQLCEADFEFEVTPTNPFEYNFTDLSIGSINAWDWDFGDGNVSDLQNPSHIFQDTGTYEVCLSVYNTDSILFCNSTICFDLIIDVPPPSCQASFDAEVDQGVNKPNLYHFVDLSQGEPDEWLWDFGDGNISTEKNPDHQYADGGTYQVSLTISIEDPWGTSCEDTEILQLTTPPYFDFGGMIFAGEFPINNPQHTDDTARVCLFREINNNLIALDTSFFTQNGYFYYMNMLSGNYLIKFNLTEYSNNVTGYFPTYFGDKLIWDDSQVLTIADSNNYAVNINLYEIPVSTIGGIGQIEGLVVLNASRFYGEGPQHNTEILLFDVNGDPYLYSYSDTDGNFVFDDLPLGTYTLIAESTGMLTEPYTLTLTDENPTIHGVQLDLYENITSISETNIKKTNFKFYPNPVGETLNILITEAMNQRFQVRIYDLLGQLMYSEEIIAGQSSKLVNINMNSFNPGVYLAEIISSQGQKHNTFKIIKK